MSRFASVLVTGGAGFIGTHILRRIAPVADRGLVFDSLHPQVHGPVPHPPTLPPHFQFVHADIRDRDRVHAAVVASDPDLVLHLAAETGTGQSYDEVSRYNDVNVMGTAYLIEAMRMLPPTPRRRRIILASSRAIYGEGLYRDEAGQHVSPPPRTMEDMAAGRFAPVDRQAGPLTPVPTPEHARAMPSSIYASTKLMQELLFEQAFVGTNIDHVTLRFQNVYGEGQSVSNPYTGVLSIFAALAARGAQLDLFEDGEIVRDFVHVSDVSAAILAAATADEAPVGAINIGTGMALTIRQAASMLLNAMGRPSDDFRITGRFRAGDIRHAVADISRAERILGWKPAVTFEQGVASLVASFLPDTAESQQDKGA
jgi:dTDP-L-rhamnose 4-epimerase